MKGQTVNLINKSYICTICKTHELLNVKFSRHKKEK
mgnify:CR=1 FL=1